MQSSNQYGYYESGGLSVYDIWRSKLTDEQFIGLCKGTVLKYVLRAGLKAGNDEIQDLQKAADYLQWWIDTLKRQEEQNV